MSHDDFSLHHASDRLNALAAMLLEAGRSTPVGTLVGPLSRLTGGLKPTASLGMGIAVGSAAVLAISAILKARAGRQEGTAAATPAGGSAARADASAASAGMAEAGSSAGPTTRGEAPAVGAAAAPPPAAASSPAEPRAKRAPRRKSTTKPAGTVR